MRSDMRDNMRGTHMRHYPMYKEDGKEWEEGYRKGYMDGWEDCEKDAPEEPMDENPQMRRRRNRMGRFM